MSFTKNVDGYQPSRKVCERYSISPRTLIRWENDPNMGFPAALRINNRKLFAEADLAVGTVPYCAGRTGAFTIYTAPGRVKDSAGKSREANQRNPK